MDDGVSTKTEIIVTKEKNAEIRKVTFKNTGADQSYNNNKSFRGTYKIIIKE